MHRLILMTLAVAPFAGMAAAQTLPPVPVPPQNPITEPKRVLGKILFWDAQLSSDNATACGTCHLSEVAGADFRTGVHPGADGVFGSADDVIGSPGMVDSEADGTFVPNEFFDLLPQVTPRSANSLGMIQYAPELFWDGRATTEFTDPDDGTVVIPTGGALENQAIGPVLSSAEMAHRNRDWSAVSARLVDARPMALATDLPDDMAQAIDVNATYPALFTAAFGDGAITARRIAMAIATYERTLVADDTPWDRTQNGQPNGLTPGQQAGFNAFLAPGPRCGLCHGPPFFTNFAFRNIGLRPPLEDLGRFEVTGNPIDRGRFKVPSLRNVGLKTTFMHNGRLSTLNDVLDFYTETNGQVQFPQNQDPAVAAIFIPPQARPALLDFLTNGLTDARVRDELFPFDRPTLHTELAPNPLVVNNGTPGSGGFVPFMVTPGTPNLGNNTFRFGLDGGLGGAEARLLLCRTEDGASSDSDVVATLGPITLDGSGAGAGFGTLAYPIANNPRLLGDVVYAQWIVTDPAGVKGESRSALVRLQFYANDPTSCGCAGDLNCNGQVGFGDLVRLLNNWGSCDLCGSDIDDDGVVGFADLVALLGAWGGC